MSTQRTDAWVKVLRMGRFVMHCTNCGAVLLDPRGRFCGNCGAPVGLGTEAGFASDPARDAGLLGAWLDEGDWGWLTDVSCWSIPEGGTGRTEADTMLRLRALYQAIRAEWPSLDFGHEVMQTIMSDERSWHDEHPDLLAGFMCCEGEFRQSGWFGSVDEVVGAAALGREGALDAVMISCDLLSQGFDFFSGDGHALIEAYQTLFPAVASYTSATAGVRFANIESGPGAWDFNGDRIPPSSPNTLARALNRQITSQQRRNYVCAASGDTREGCPSSMFLPIASALGLDCSFLSLEEVSEAQIFLNDLNLRLATPEDHDWEGYLSTRDLLEALHLGYVVGANLDRLLADVAGIASSDRSAQTLIAERHPWIREWASNSFWYLDCWPDGPLREMLQSSVWDFPQSIPRYTDEPD